MSGGRGGPSPAAIVSAIGNIVQGFGGFQSSRAKAAALKAAAKDARREAGMQAQMATDEAERAGALAAVRGAASGGGFDGSFEGALSEMEQTGRFNARSAIWSGNVEAANRLYEAKVAKMDGNYQLLSSTLQASSTLASSHMNRAEQSKQKDYRKKINTYGGGR